MQVASGKEAQRRATEILLVSGVALLITFVFFFLPWADINQVRFS